MFVLCFCVVCLQSRGSSMALVFALLFVLCVLEHGFNIVLWCIVFVVVLCV